MTDNVEQIYRERTSLRTLLAAAVVLILGVTLLVLSNGVGWFRDHPNVDALVRDIGSLMVVSVAVTLIWELTQKRAFIDELMKNGRSSITDLISQTLLTEEVKRAGLTSFSLDFSYGVKWPTLFKNANKVDLFFSYAKSWLNNNEAQLQTLSRREGVRLRVVLPDPEDKALVAELARRYSKQDVEIRDNILSARDNFYRIFVIPFQDGASANRPDFQLFYTKVAPQFTFYRFDSACVLALYKHRTGRGGVPVFQVEQGGTIYDFIQQEMDEFTKNTDLARQEYPPTIPSTNAVEK
jgi:hypothetical protein